MVAYEWLQNSMSLYSRRHIDFLLDEVIQMDSLLRNPYFAAHDREGLGFILDAAHQLAEEVLNSAYTDSDRRPAKFSDGKIQTHPALSKFVNLYTESGFLSASLPEKHEGIQVPKSVMAAANFILLCSHNSFVMYPDLLSGCLSLIESYGSDEQKKQFIPKMTAGEWFGTMCLTEPDAGSSLSNIQTKAFPREDGTYRIKGQKIFISAGDHELGENIIHMVLARMEGAPAGVRGISLFIVPKFDLESGSSNDVKTLGIFEKMGQKATPAVHLGFGSENNCKAYLLGKPHEGLKQMFKMMNEARLGVGLSGIGMASAAFQRSLAYAKERKQGQKDKKEVAIIEHADVRRMLLRQKAISDGGLALLLQTYSYIDHLKTGLATEKYAALLDLLTPVCKTFGSEMGNLAVHEGMQIFGGYGYTKDFPMEQMARDVRILSIYEGTTGIQSQALLGRQILATGNLSYFLEEINQVIEEGSQLSAIQAYAQILSQETTHLQEITLKLKAETDNEAALADATVFMDYFGLVTVGWQWLKMAVVATRKLKERFYGDLLYTADYFFTYEFSRVHHLREVLKNDKKLTLENGGLSDFSS